MSHEAKGKSNEWYTPEYVFDALSVEFDLDVASPVDTTYCSVPTDKIITQDSLEKKWKGFVWMNPPFGDSKTKEKWINKFISHGNGIALFPDRTSATWWQMICKNSDLHFFTNHRIQFVDPNGNLGKQPANGTTLFAIGEKGMEALFNAQANKLGEVYKSVKQ